MKVLLAYVGMLYCAAMPILAETISLNPSADTSLFQTTADNNLGGGTLSAGTTAHGQFSRALIKFDVADRMPPNVVISAVRLRLNVVRAPLGGQSSTFLLRRVLRDWGEGDKIGNLGEPAVDGEASWNNRFHPSTPWQSPGGATGVDYVGNASSSSPSANDGTMSFDSSPQMIADVQAWLTNSDQNFGWIVISGSEQTWATARRFGSKEDAASAPVLEIDYAPPFRIENVALKNRIFQFSFPVEPLFTYTVEARQELSSGSWNVLTNFTETFNSYEATISDTAGGPSGFYRVLKEPCNCQ